MSDDTGGKPTVNLGGERRTQFVKPQVRTDLVDSQMQAPNLLATSAYTDGNPVPTFVINAQHVITHWNKACEQTIGRTAAEMVGTRNQWQPFYPLPRPVLADLIVDGEADEVVSAYYHNKVLPSSVIPGAFEVEDFFPSLCGTGRWLHFSAAPMRDDTGSIVGAIEVLQDVTQRKLAENDLRQIQLDLEDLVTQRTEQLAQANGKLESDIQRREIAETELLQRNAELTQLNEKLSMAQEQLVQSEKLASIGQLAAGVAHEINNPIGYIFSNFNSLSSYIEDLFTMLVAYERAEKSVAVPEILAELVSIREKIDLQFLKEDIPTLMRESKEGIVRVRKIVQDLKDFSRVQGSQDWQWANLHQGIDTTLNIVSNEIKYKADVIKEYGDIPDIECLPSEINQVVMNIVVNASHAIGEQRGTITIRTCRDGEDVLLEISDTGSGIPKEIQSRIFDPFFTTKAIGKGTGLGLSLSYGIIQKHHGQISVESEPGKGTCFRIRLPIRHVVEDRQDQEQQT